MNIFNKLAGYSNIRVSSQKNVGLTTLPADRIGNGGAEKEKEEKELEKRYRRRGRGELFTEAVIADEAGPSKRHGKRFY